MSKTIQKQRLVDQILELLEQNPGGLFRYQIKNALRRSHGSTSYAIEYLKVRGIIKQKHGKFVLVREEVLDI